MALTKIPAHLSSTPSISDSGSATAITIDSSGNVVLAGNLSVTGSTTTADNLVSADKNIILNYHASNDTSGAADGAGITIQDAVNSSTDATMNWVAANDRFRFSHGLEINSGNVGIGTTAPATDLQIGDYTDNAETITIATASDQTGRINFYNNNSTEGASLRVTGGGNGAKMYFANRYDADQDKVTFDLVNGRVGIGITAPDTLLHLKGSSGTQLTVDTTSGQRFAQINMEQNGTQKAAMWIDNTTSLFAHYAIAGWGMHFYTGATERMRILADGNVGIGTDAPGSYTGIQSNLEVKNASHGGIAINAGTNSLGMLAFAQNGTHRWSIESENSSTPALKFNEAGTYRMIIDNGGNVGIGVTSGIDGKLHVGGNVVVGNASTTAFSSFTAGGLDVAVGSGTKAFQVWDDNVTGTPRFIVERGGDVGIGKASPESPLHIEESVSTAYDGDAQLNETLIISNKHGTDDSGVNNYANLSFRVADGATSYGFINYVRRGNNTGKFTFSQRTASNTWEEILHLGSTNVFMGPESGGTVETSSGTENVAIGSRAMDDASSGSGNVAVGRESLANLQGGSDNVAVGKLAGFTQTSASANAFVGSQAGRMTTGSSNTYLGYYAGRNARAGGENVAIGKEALLSGTNSDAANNVAIGVETLKDTSSGTQNVAVGKASGQQASSGSYNTFAGAYTGQSIGSGNYNTCIGYQAGKVASGGTNNILLGKDAGMTGSPGGQISNDSNHLIIGDENIGNFYCTQTSISSSDERDKTDITNFTGGLDWIKAMRPVTYKWDKRVWYANAALTEGEELTPEKILAASSDGSLKVDDLQVGLLAQEVLDVEKANGYGASNETSLLVDLTSDETRYGLKYSLIVPVLVSAIKEQQTIIDDLKSRIETLEG